MEDRDYNTIAAMFEHGGGFVKKLAELAQMADGFNLQKIKATWPDYWRQYERLGNEPRTKRADE